MSGETDLKPCPSCKSEQVEMMSVEWEHYGYCNSCEMQGPKSQDQQKAKSAWDDLPRATPPGLEAVPEGTMAALEAITSTTEFTEILQGLDGRPCDVFIARPALRDAIHQCRAILTRHRATQDKKDGE